jgi:hypothetical protein
MMKLVVAVLSCALCIAACGSSNKGTVTTTDMGCRGLGEQCSKDGQCCSHNCAKTQMLCDQ